LQPPDHGNDTSSQVTPEHNPEPDNEHAPKKDDLLICHQPCLGFSVDCFQDGQNAYLFWPFGLHAMLKLEWDVHVVDGMLLLQSPQCRKIAGDDGCTCQYCRRITHDEHFHHIEHQLQDGTPETLSHYYCGVSELLEVVG